MRTLPLLALLLALTGCPGPFWGRICLGGTTDPSEACVVADGSMVGLPAAVVGAVAGAHALNHDPYNAFNESLERNQLHAVDAGTGASAVASPDSGAP